MFKRYIITIFVSMFMMPVSFGAGCKEGDFKDCLAKAKQGDSEAQYSLGIMYNDGDGILKNYKKAVHWVTKSAKQGHDYAQAYLGLMYQEGRGVPLDYQKSIYWYKKSVKQGNIFAQATLGTIYLLTLDFKRAYMWLNIASYNVFESEEGKETLDAEERKEFAEGIEEGLNKIENFLSTSEINEAQEWGQICIDSNYKNCKYE